MQKGDKMDWLLHNALPEENRKKVGFCFREKHGVYYAFPAEGYKIMPGSGFGSYINARNFRSLVDLTGLLIVPAL